MKPLWYLLCYKRLGIALPTEKCIFLDAVHLAHKNEAHPFWDAPINRFETSLKKEV